MDVGRWLDSLGLERFAAAFRENDVTFEVLRHLTADDLKDLGVAAVGQRRQILLAVSELRDSASVPHSGGLSGGDRRQLTVMFCDLVDSTALADRLDPEELGGLLHLYRNLCGTAITRYDGFVARHVGDGILAYFGWPVAHEEDAERAVRAALKIVQTVKRASSIENLSVRIGIASGPVVVGEAADTRDPSSLAVGSTPNLAARLQGFASAGEIIIASSTRRLVGHGFELTDLGDHDLKGITQPVHLWRVEQAVATESRFDARSGGNRLTPLAGREEELQLLMHRWALARRGDGQVVVVSGEPGIGKSRILRALRERLEEQGARALRFQCSPYYVNSELWPNIDRFERALAFAADETVDAKLDQLEAVIVTRYARPLSDVRFVASLLSIPFEHRYGMLSVTPQKHKEETLRTLVELVEADAREQPGVVLFEDVHWADPTTLEMLDLLIERVKTVPILVVLTQRPDHRSRWSHHRHVGTMNVSGLTRRQTGAMISALAGGKRLPPGLFEQIVAKTDGIPLFVEELTKSVLESDDLRIVGDYYVYGRSALPMTIPATLQDSLMARLDRSAPVKQIAQIGAAIGRQFSYELIAGVAPMLKKELDDALAQLVESGLATSRGAPPDSVYVFKHALVQDAAYDSLLKSRRPELHGKIARLIEERFPNVRTAEPAVLAHHLTAAGLIEAAVPLWKTAGDLALERWALTEATAHFNQALKLIAALPSSPERDAIELGLRSRRLAAWLACTSRAASKPFNNSPQPGLNSANLIHQQRVMLPIFWGLTIRRPAPGIYWRSGTGNRQPLASRPIIGGRAE